MNRNKERKLAMSILGQKIYKTFAINTEQNFQHLDNLKDQYQSLKPFSTNEILGLDSYNEAFLVHFVYNTNAIEGSTLTPGETALVLEGEFVPDKPGSEYFKARGTADGFAYYQKALLEKRTFDQSLIKDIHERTALDNQPATRGVYRQHSVYLKGSNTVPADWEEIRLLLSELFEAYQHSTLHPIEKAATFHMLFENIHPFSDGNGRVGRLLLNYLLEQDGYPPIAIKFDNKTEYLSSLEKWQINEDGTQFMTLIKSSISSEIQNRIECVLKTRNPAKTKEPQK
jgi:Fic family protein